MMSFTITVGFSGGATTSATCKSGHVLQRCGGRNATCDICRISGLTTSFACWQCNYDMCDNCAANAEAGNQVQTSKLDFDQTFYGYTYYGIPTNQKLKFLDRNHNCNLFIGNDAEAGDHKAWGCLQSGFNATTYDKRTNFTIVPTNDGYYQIFDEDKEAYLFVGDGVDHLGDRVVWASPQKNWGDYNNFLFRTSFTFVPVEGGYRILDKKHNSYLFVGNDSENGDHGLFSVPVTKFNNDVNQWHKRTIFDLIGGVVAPPTNNTIKLRDVDKGTFCFVGNTLVESDRNVWAALQSGFQVQNFHKRTGVVIVPTPTGDGYYQIMDTNHKAYFFVGDSVDHGGDRTLWASPQENWGDYNNFIYRTSFTFEHVGDGTYRIKDKKHNSYLFVGNDSDNGDHMVYSVPEQKFNNDRGQWERRTLWKVKY